MQVLKDGTKVYPLIRVIPKGKKSPIMIAVQEFDEKLHTAVDTVGKEIKAVVVDPTGGEGKKDDDNLDLSNMSAGQLKAFAAANSIDITGAVSKADLAKVIEAWKAAKGV